MIAAALHTDFRIVLGICSYVQVGQEWELDNFKLHQSDEDIHTAIERRLKVKN